MNLKVDNVTHIMNQNVFLEQLNKDLKEKLVKQKIEIDKQIDVNEKFEIKNKELI